MRRLPQAGRQPPAQQRALTSSGLSSSGSGSSVRAARWICPAAARYRRPLRHRVLALLVVGGRTAESC
eukprot:11203122-Lingulodinium_polyedra.AAC.1